MQFLDLPSKGHQKFFKSKIIISRNLGWYPLKKFEVIVEELEEVSPKHRPIHDAMI